MKWFQVRNDLSNDHIPADSSIQEPYAYEKHFYNHQGTLSPYEDMYLAVKPICRYFIRLRYTLLQLMYDALFENLYTGLPIVRCMVSMVPNCFPLAIMDTDIMSLALG
jgi:alpha-glucosidase (family GH31 glycosyl hydrolase)